MSEIVATDPHATATAPAESASSPEFDRQELAMFGQDDGHAVTVIGKMLVGFFFYSFIIMSAVAIWTLTHGGQVPDQPPPDAHAEEAEE